MLDRRCRSCASTTSPGFSPALAAGPPATTAETSAPGGRSRPSDSAICGVTGIERGADIGPLEKSLPLLADATTAAHDVGRDGEADADRAAAAAVDRRVDADQLRRSC